MDSPLHETYAPILHFAKDERFLPLAAEDLLAQAALYRHGEEQPLAAAGRVRPEHLLQMAAQDVFLRVSAAAPLTGADLAGAWSRDMLALTLDWARYPATPAYDAGRAQRLYRWYAENTQPATEPFWWNDIFMAPTVSLRRRGTVVEQPRFPLPAEARDQAQARCASQSSREYTYYYRQAQYGDYLVLQYWFLYAYNDWATSYDGLNDHEGDWEGIQLLFRCTGDRPTEPPAYIAFLNHGSRLIKPWHHPDAGLSGTHPHVYVAAGSHACYPERKRYELMRLYGLYDQATGDGATIRPGQWQSCVDLDKAPWITTFQGGWGTRYRLAFDALRELLGAEAAPGDVALPAEIALPGVSGPGGPRYAALGCERAAWAQPLQLAGLAKAEQVPA